MLLGWSRAILLQLAHPLVAAGVAEHSTFRRGRFGTAARLHHTVRAMLALTFGDDVRRESALEDIRTIHRRVNGTLTRAAGHFPPGTPYSAENPDLLLWVHVTLVDSVLLLYGKLFSLTPAQCDEYCADSAWAAIALGARPHDVPTTWTSLRECMDRRFASGDIVVGDDARWLAAAVLSPPLATLIWPVRATNQLVTLGLLPPAIRQQYGFSWTTRNDRRLDWLLRGLRIARSLAPRPLALWPEARRA